MHTLPPQILKIMTYKVTGKLPILRIPLKYFTQEIRDEYNIIDIVDNGHVYIKNIKGCVRPKGGQHIRI